MMSLKRTDRVPMNVMQKAWMSFRRITGTVQEEPFWEYLGNWDRGKSLFNQFRSAFELDEDQRNVIDLLLSPHAETLLKAHSLRHDRELPLSAKGDDDG